MKTKTINLYSFDELSEEAKKKAIENLRDINVDYDWWDFIYEDAETIGLKITSFDLDRNRFAQGELLDSIENVANLIIKNHGEHCQTYKDAKKFLDNYLPVKGELDAFEETEEQYDPRIVDKLDGQCNDLITEFEESLLENYSIMLQEERDYQLTDEAIIETIKANDYTFTENGKLEN